MLALIAGTGALPDVLVARLPERPLICAMLGSAPERLTADITFRLEHLGSFLADLQRRGVTHLCMAGAVRRPGIDPSAIDAATRPLVPVIQQALAAGDDGALRAIIALIEDHGLTVTAAHDIAPDLLPPAGVLTRIQPPAGVAQDARLGAATIAEMGRADTGQACVIRAGRVIAREGPGGTAALLAQLRGPMPWPDATDPFSAATDVAGDLLGGVADWLSGEQARPPGGGILYKAPKPDQDRRADLPLIGPDTARQAAAAGLAGIVIEAGGVMVLDRARVVAALEAEDMFLWVRP